MNDTKSHTQCIDLDVLLMLVSDPPQWKDAEDWRRSWERLHDVTFLAVPNDHLRAVQAVLEG